VAVKLLLFPGLGADARMFYPQAGLGTALNLPEPRRGESLADLARRIELPGDGPFVFGGVSMGGMVALELAKIRPCKGVLLIASSRNTRMVPPVAEALSWILKAAPDLGPNVRLPAWRMLVSRLGPLSDADQRLLAEALHAHPLDRLREYTRMILEWEGVADPGVPVRHIHGDRDQIIPLRYVKPDVVIRGAGHGVNLSHAENVNDAIRQTE
jgi:pimeloyl-ACP methyl ester carboxylesterase